MEQIYTIPVNEAFESCAASEEAQCPFCALYNKYERDEIDLILGASMMEPDIRKKTNEKGFCRTHFDLMLAYSKRLPLALILESHLTEVRSKVRSGSFLASLKASSDAKKLDRLGDSCYVCERLDYNFDRASETAVLLWEGDEAFRKKCASQKMFCIPHYSRFLALGKDRLSKKEFSAFYNDVSHIEGEYFDKISGDVNFFVKKFDYRFTDEPWGDKKNAPEKAIAFLTSDVHKAVDGKKSSDGLTDQRGIPKSEK
jgi:hypothetical protein